MIASRPCSLFLCERASWCRREGGFLDCVSGKDLYPTCCNLLISIYVLIFVIVNA